MNDRSNIRFMLPILSYLLQLHTQDQIVINKVSNLQIALNSLKDRKLRLSKTVTLFYFKSILEANHENSYINGILQCIIKCINQLDISNFNEYKSSSESKSECIKISK